MDSIKQNLTWSKQLSTSSSDKSSRITDSQVKQEIKV